MICIIPARGGSKRLPGKNLLKLEGEYLINRVITTALESRIFEEIIVSTDSKEIADIVKGATVSIRPPEISGDIPEDKVLQWTGLEYYGMNLCRIYPFAVLLTAERLCKGYTEFLKGKYDNVMECQKYGHNPVRGFYLPGKYEYPNMITEPTETLEAFYHDAATFMFTHRGSLDKPLPDRKIKWIPVKELEAQDIDDVDDWEMLKAKWGNKK